MLPMMMISGRWVLSMVLKCSGVWVLSVVLVFSVRWVLSMMLVLSSSWPIYIVTGQWDGQNSRVAKMLSGPLVFVASDVQKGCAEIG